MSGETSDIKSRPFVLRPVEGLRERFQQSVWKAEVGGLKQFSNTPSLQFVKEFLCGNATGR
jgi:hypothetical protein